MINTTIAFFLLSCVYFVSAFASVPPEAWDIIVPYQMGEDHPLKPALDQLFFDSRVLHNRESLVSSGFENKAPEPRTGVFVLRHPSMKGYVFKLYTDDLLSYYRNEPEYVTWMLRARGARLIRREIKANRWGKYFKAPRKWIYALPGAPKAREGTLPKNFILVEEEMDILANTDSRKKWSDGTINKEILDKLFFLITKTGLRGGCKYDNVPMCSDGRIAFIDTQNNLSWPLPYERLFPVLKGKMLSHWKSLIKRNRKHEK